MTRTISEKRHAFRALHEEGCFVLPNPWDVGSARYLASMGFKAIATTSSGFAWSTGKPDNAVSRDTVIAHLREMVRATDLPVNADFESGFGSNPAEVAQSVRMAVDAGVAVERLAAARRTIDETGGDTLLVGRAENFVAGVPDLEDAIARLRAYAQAGADCLYAPGIQTREQIEAVVAAVRPKPVNLLIGGPSAFTLDELAKLGVRRVSVGGALARAAWGGLVASVQSLADGRFDSLPKEPSGGWLNSVFKGPA